MTEEEVSFALEVLESWEENLEVAIDLSLSHRAVKHTGLELHFAKEKNRYHRISQASLSLGDPEDLSSGRQVLMLMLMVDFHKIIPSED